MNAIEAQSRIEALFQRTVNRDPLIRNAYFLVHSERLGVHLKLAEGTDRAAPVHEDQPYYIASVSKLFAAVLCARLVEEGLLGFDDPISDYLDPELLRGLHLYKGQDFGNAIRVKHLLNHSSGLNDFFEDKPKGEASMLELIFGNAQRGWTPREMVEWTKTRLKNHFPPGAGFHYSDTGYHLLGIALEQATGKPYHELLRRHLFEPLDMKQTWFSRYSEPIEQSNGSPTLARLYDRNRDVTELESLSFMYAGGGVVSTTADQLKLMKALVEHRIVGETTLAKMKSERGRFFPGIDYGYGLMIIKPMFLLMPGKYSSWGNMGTSGSWLFYHPETDAYLIGGLNQFRYNRKGLRLMFKAIDILRRCDRQR
ncbi:serine hydrolase [Cohnella sp. LGH]|uniref:serine hydrolase domain-containing protein n=1 Tax=Cohnella sp. LGH TaxID=1619153 RepID=UPI001AD9A5D5|nr:serine hydrolase [Cohnella sp. LGH]QTH46323.1 serine hydrolase [Cohnella sp. LGH]